ncbi:MAG TPA: GAF domain-containing protein [Albitalea sp.]|nr:GAF domain-containing protein [Albitalea sp.]
MGDLAAIDLLCNRHDAGEVDGRAFLAGLPALVAQAIGCSRAGVRVAVETPAGRVLRAVTMHQRSVGRLVEVPDLAGDGVEPYLESLARQGGVIAPDVNSHPRVLRLLRGYAESQQLRSLMDAGISIDGMLYGALSCEQLGSPQQWSPRQLHLLRRVALRASPALVRLVADQVTAPGRLWDMPGPGRRLPLNS